MVLKVSKHKTVLILLLMLISLTISAQTKIEGEAEAKAGLGSATPWGTNVKLNITTPKLTIEPFIGVYGITEQSSAMKNDIKYIYNSSSDYLLNSDSHRLGYDLLYGTDIKYDLNQWNTFSALVKGNHFDVQSNSIRREKLMLNQVVSTAYSELDSPIQNDDYLNVEAAFVHRSKRVGESVSVRYIYNLTTTEEEMHQTVEESGNLSQIKESNDLCTKATTSLHSVLLDWKLPLCKGHTFNLGARYDDKTIDSHDEQMVDGTQILDEDFHHRTRVAAAYAAYNLNVGAISASASLEYNYTRMQEKNLNDFIPFARILWKMNSSNSLTATYAMRLIRPSISFLNPGHIIGNYTIDYGNAELIGTHAKNVSLAYNHNAKKVQYSTTLSHIFADDGFCAIWMLKDGMRVSTWGNQGVRRAWSLTPEIKWDATPKTLVSAKATVMWDKRIAYAINMAKEHWGIDAKLRVQQTLPIDVVLGIHGDYSEGNTVDLYSHYGRSLGFGADLKRAFLHNKNLLVTIAYDYQDYADIILTQGAYTGIVYSRPANNSALAFSLGYKF